MLAYPSFTAASATSFPAIANSWFIGCSLAAIYFVPALVAFFRKQQNRWFILVLNFLFGWTIVGWIIYLAWAASAPAGEPVVVVQTVPPVPSRPLTVSHPKRPNNHIPQIRNIDPYLPSPSNAVPKRHYPSMPARSHEGYY